MRTIIDIYVILVVYVTKGILLFLIIYTYSRVLD